MSILLDEQTRVLIQGFTGDKGTFHAKEMIAYGTNVVGGVTPGKGGTTHLGRPVFNTVKEAVANTGAAASLILVPAPFCADAIMEAADAGIRLVVTITDGVPAQDMMGVKRYLWRYAKERRTTLIGPNCAGIISAGRAMMGIMPGHIYARGAVGVVTRSGTLGYEAASQMQALGVGITTSVGIGGDPINGSSFVDILALFELDPATEAVMMIGEIGGPQEADAARFVKEQMAKPVIGYVAGLTAPKGRRMGHAGAIISAYGDTAAEKHEIMRSAGLIVAPSPAQLGATVAAALRQRLNADDHPLATPELTEALRTADALLPTVTDRLTAEVLGVEPLRARILANYGVGFNHIDTRAAKARGVVVTNTPDVLTDDTADDALMLLLMVARRGAEGDRHVRSGAWTGWRPTHMLGTRVSGKTIGLIGLGRIGRAVAHRARHGFGMRVIFHDPYPPPPAVVAELGAEPRDSVDDVLREADFVSLHSPATPETHHLIDARRLALMKRGAFLINNARGDIVDEAALVAALKRGTIAGAGLDVFEREPAVAPELLSMENVVLLPHLGSATQEARVAMGLRALDNLKAFFSGAQPRDRVV